MIFKTSLLGIIRTTIFGILIAGVSNAVTITVTNNTPNGTASGGTGSGSGLFTTSAGSVSSNRGMPVTTYSVTNVDLTSVGGSATESFTFTITYTANGGSPAFNSFGNVAVTGGDNNQIDGLEDLTAVIGLNSSSFAGLSLTGYTSVRTGGLGGSESGTVTHGGGSVNATSTNTAFNVSGTSLTFDPAAATGFNFQGFTAEFVAVPEPSAALIGTLGLVFLLRRRR